LPVTLSLRAADHSFAETTIHGRRTPIHKKGRRHDHPAPYPHLDIVTDISDN
jgi:hypothetical protein